jgi:hypothetical protein
MDTFALLNIIALGALGGAITGLAIGFAANRQKPAWSAMSGRDKMINIALVLFFTVIYSGALLWYGQG